MMAESYWQSFQQKRVYKPLACSCRFTLILALPVVNQLCPEPKRAPRLVFYGTLSTLLKNILFFTIAYRNIFQLWFNGLLFCKNSHLRPIKSFLLENFSSL